MSKIVQMKQRGVRAKLREAHETGAMVRLWRAEHEVASFTGFVVGMGKEFFLLWALGDYIGFDGIYALRHRDVTEIEVPDKNALFLVKAMALKVGGINNTTPSVGGGVFQIGFGAAAAEVPVLAVPNRMGTALDNYGPMPDFWFPCSIPAGSRVAARWMSTVTDATDRICDIIAYGLECA